MRIKIAMFFMLACFAVPGVFAASQYGVDLHDDGYAVKAYTDPFNHYGNGRGWYLSALDNASLSLKLTRSDSSTYDRLGYFTFSGETIRSVGTFNFDADGIASIDRLAAGTNVGFWITGSDGVTRSSMAFADPVNWRYVFNGRGTYGANGEFRNFEYTGKGNAFAANVLFSVGEASGSAGQPLPGVAAVLICGISAVAFSGRKRR